MERTETGVRELKAHLSAYLRKVEAGATVTVTRHGKPIGRIVPARDEEKSTMEKMKALQEAGIIKWNGKKPQHREPVAKVKGDRMVSDLLLEDRR